MRNTAKLRRFSPRRRRRSPLQHPVASPSPPFQANTENLGSAAARHTPPRTLVLRKLAPAAARAYHNRRYANPPAESERDGEPPQLVSRQTSPGLHVPLMQRRRAATLVFFIQSAAFRLALVWSAAALRIARDGVGFGRVVQVRRMPLVGRGDYRRGICHRNDRRRSERRFARTDAARAASRRLPF